MSKQVFHEKEQQKIFVLGEGFYPSPKIADKFYPGCTTILDVFPKGFGFQQYLKDVGNNATEILERAGAFGSKVHASTEELNNGAELRWISKDGSANYTIEEWKSVLRYFDFWKKCEPELIANELKMCSDDLRFGLTLDRVLMINGKRFLVDIKTSNYLHKTYELQTAACSVMWNHFNPDQPIEHTAILWLKANVRTSKIDHEKLIYQGVTDAGAWQLKVYETHYYDSFKLFEHVQAIWESLPENKNYKPKNLIFPDRIKL